MLLADEGGRVRPTLRQGEGRLVPLHVAATCLSRSCCCLVRITGPNTAPSPTISSKKHLPVRSCSQMPLDPRPAWLILPSHTLKHSTGLPSCRCRPAAASLATSWPPAQVTQTTSTMSGTNMGQCASAVWVSAPTSTDSGSGTRHAGTEAGVDASAPSCPALPPPLQLVRLCTRLPA